MTYKQAIVYLLEAWWVPPRMRWAKIFVRTTTEDELRRMASMNPVEQKYQQIHNNKRVISQ